MTDEDPDHKAYLQERQSNIDAEHSEAATFDKWLITLSSGAFALSIAFFKDIAQGTPRVGTEKLIMGAWALLLLSIFCTMTSLLASQAAFRRYREILDHRYSNDTDEKPNESNPWDTVVLVLNVFAMIGFLMGATLMALFCFNNIKP